MKLVGTADPRPARPPRGSVVPTFADVPVSHYRNRYRGHEILDTMTHGAWTVVVWVEFTEAGSYVHTSTSDHATGYDVVSGLLSRPILERAHEAVSRLEHRERRTA